MAGWLVGWLALCHRSTTVETYYLCKKNVFKSSTHTHLDSLHHLFHVWPLLFGFVIWLSCIWSPDTIKQAVPYYNIEVDTSKSFSAPHRIRLHFSLSLSCFTNMSPYEYLHTIPVQPVCLCAFVFVQNMKRDFKNAESIKCLHRKRVCVQHMHTITGMHTCQRK